MRALTRSLLLLLPFVAVMPAHAGRPAAGPVPDVDVVASPPVGATGELPASPVFAKDVPPDLQQAVRDALTSSFLRGSRVSMQAVRVSDGTPLFSLQEDALLNPASCVKLMTTAAALRILRPHHRFSTEFLAAGSLDGDTLKGDLIVRGLGDPTLTQERLYKVATELSARGLRTVTGNLILDDTYFDQQWEAPGWEQEQNADRAYAAPVGALSLTQNTLAIYVRPGARRGARGVVQVEPSGGQVVVESQVATTRVGRRIWVKTIPDGDKTRVLVQGVMGLHEPAERVVRRITNPTQNFGAAFLEMLKARGIRVKGRMKTGTTPDSARAIWTELSPTLREIVNVLNHHSSNFVAEMLLKDLGAQVLGAPGTTQKGLQVVQAFLEREMGMPGGSYIMGNGSGLNDVNRFTTAQITGLLRRMAQDGSLAPEFLGSLAVAGSGGTLGHRMGQTAADGQLRGKTGTLLGVSALSGYVNTPRHGLVAFSILVNGLSGPTSVAWDMQDRIGAALAGETAASLAMRRATPASARMDTPGGGGP